MVALLLAGGIGASGCADSGGSTSATVDAGPSADTAPLAEGDAPLGPELDAIEPPAPRDTARARDAAAADEGDLAAPDDVGPAPPGEPCESGAGAACDDGIACTEGDRCDDGECRGEPDHGRCDDGNPCTRDRCVASEGCVHDTLTGTGCALDGPCEEGRCERGVCRPYVGCDDGLVCTTDACERGAGCAHQLVDTVGHEAPEFALRDVNPRSATYHRVVTRERGDVAVLLFHDARCGSCLANGQAARLVHAALSRELDTGELLFATVNSPDGANGAIDQYTGGDVDGTPPLESRWPVLQDTDLAYVWDRYCAMTDDVTIIGRDGRILYRRAVNFTDPPFREELLYWIRDALARPGSETEPSGLR